MLKKQGFSLLELLITVAVIGLWAAILLPALAQAREAARRTSCQSNLKQWGQVFALFANESKENRFPPLEMEPGCGTHTCFAWAPLFRAVYPEYLTDPSIVFCPSDKHNTLANHIGTDGSLTLGNKPIEDRLSGVEALDASYTYFPWVLDRVNDWDPTDVSPRVFRRLLSEADQIGFENLLDCAEIPAQFLSLRQDLISATRALGPSLQDMSVFDAEVDKDRRVEMGNGNKGGEMIFRLRKGIERFLITDPNSAPARARAASNIFVMCDNPGIMPEQFNHASAGCNVLYLDGHVSFVKSPGLPPVNKKMAGALYMLSGRYH